MKLFPETPQKLVSGFITSLWGKEPNRRRWGIIAKLYSIVRDAFGKNEVKLARYLCLACPIMNVISPQTYLSALGWSVQEDDNGIQILVKRDVPKNQENTHPIPATEADLLSALITTGYLPSGGHALLQKMINHGKDLTTFNTFSQTTEAATDASSDTTQSEHEHIAEELFIPETPVAPNSTMSISSYFTEGVAATKQLPLQPFSSQANLQYSYAGPCDPYPMTIPVASFEVVPQWINYDVSDPWDFNAMLVDTQMTGLNGGKT